jgi:hypothetical protein
VCVASSGCLPLANTYARSLALSSWLEIPQVSISLGRPCSLLCCRLLLAVLLNIRERTFAFAASSFPLVRLFVCAMLSLVSSYGTIPGYNDNVMIA